ncbi:hypothetical protein TNCV_3150251, partial [Trichonephila clavipes]
MEPKAESRVHAIFFKQLNHSENDMQQSKIDVNLLIVTVQRDFHNSVNTALNNSESFFSGCSYGNFGKELGVLGIYSEFRTASSREMAKMIFRGTFPRTSVGESGTPAGVIARRDNTLWREILPIT